LQRHPRRGARPHDQPVLPRAEPGQLGAGLRVEHRAPRPGPDPVREPGRRRRGMSAPNPLDVPDVTEPYQPRSGQRFSGFLTEPLRFGTTPSATVGPYLAIGLTWADGVWVVAEGTEGGIWIRGRVFDGAGDVVPDAMI